MNDNKKDFYTWILKIALEYRLSLENICIILGIEATEKNQEKMYNIFNELFGLNTDLKGVYDILFKYETKNELEETSLNALNSGFLAFYQYQIALRNNDTFKLESLKNQLNILDNKIKELKNRDTSYELSYDDYLNITKYRIKYSLSKSEICKMLNISNESLIRFEVELENDELNNKLSILNKNQLNVLYSRSTSYNPENILLLEEEKFDSKLMEMCYKRI